MEIAEKKALRLEKLRTLYDHNERQGGREAHIRYVDLYSNEQEKMEHIAYEYLEDKGFIDYKLLGRNYYSAKITSRGIDYVENEM